MKIRYSIFSLALASLAIILNFTSCEDEKTWDGPTYTKYLNKSIVTPVVTGVDDASVTFTVDVPANGMVYYDVLTSDDDAPADSMSWPEEATYKTVVKAAGTKTITVSGLDDWQDYVIYTCYTNDYGMPSGFGSASFKTTDVTAPSIIAYLPANGAEGVSSTITSVKMAFSEPVVYDASKKIRLVDAFDGSDLGITGSVSVSGQVIIIGVTGTFDYLTEVAVEMDSGAFLDLAGNRTHDTLGFDADAGAWDYSFTIEPIIDMTVFEGAYHVVANEVGFGNGPKEYDVLIDAGSTDTSLFVVGLNGWIGSFVELTLDPNEDTCGFITQPTGMTYPGNGEDIMVTSIDAFGLTTAPFVPGSFNRDGSQITCFAEISISLGYFGFYEITMTKLGGEEAATVERRIRSGESAPIEVPKFLNFK